MGSRFCPWPWTRSGPIDSNLSLATCLARPTGWGGSFAALPPLRGSSCRPRIESFYNSDISPRLATVEEYARMPGYSIKIDFEPGADRIG